MEFWVRNSFGVLLFFTICCLLCATIYVLERFLNGKNSFTLAWFQSGGRRISLRPWNKTRYLKCVEELLKSIDKFSNDCGSLKISIEQCQLLRSECLRFVQPTQPHSILKESFCAIRRALKLMQDCCSENWLLKAVEFGNCQRHFLEILLDLHRLPIVVDLIGFRGESLDDMATEFRSIDISKETKLKIGKAWEFDTKALSIKLESESRHNYPDHCLADQLQANPSLIAPDDIGRYVTEFPFNKSPCIPLYEGRDICVFPVTFCNKEFVIKMRVSKPGAEVLEDSEDIKLQKEATFMKKCRHPYAVALLGSWEAKRTDGSRVPFLLMESMECDLKSIIERNKRRWWWGGTGGFPALDAINLVLPVAKVMKYVHEKGVVHLDLKPENILFTRVPGTQDRPEDVSVKLADFGEAQMAEAGLFVEGEVISRVGTVGYMDPDVWDRKRGVDLVKADVFSFGMVFGEVLTGLSPLEALDCKYCSDFYGKLQRGEQLPLPKETPKFVKSIVEGCWNLKPDKRPSFDDICWKLQNTEFLLLNGCT